MKTVENRYGIEVGTPATFGCYTDSHPAIVTAVTATTITLREVATGPNTEEWPSQNFPVYLDQPVGAPIVYRFTKRGWKSANDYYASIGHARKYVDPHF